MGRRLAIARSWLGDLAGVIFPRVCEVCSRSLTHGEDTMCLYCLTDMPRVDVHTDHFSIIHKRLASNNIPLERCASWFYYFRDNPFARMIQRAKYNSRPALARKLGAMYAAEIMPDGFFDGIDMIVPVPLHRLKYFIRGYNQSEEIGLGISSVTGIPVQPGLLKARRHSTQTRRNAYDRWLNTRNIFSLADTPLPPGSHLLLVDDVLTTGATILGCMEAIHTAEPTVKISVLTLGLTHYSG